MKIEKVKNLIILVVLLLSIGCTISDKREPKPLIFSYRILEKEDFHFEKAPDIEFYTGSLLLNLPDTLITYISIAECIIEICLNENFIAAEVYKNEQCWNMKIGKEVMNNEIFNECYIGFIDNTSRDLNWKYKIRIEDFRFNDTEGLPLKIDL